MTARTCTCPDIDGVRWATLNCPMHVGRLEIRPRKSPMTLSKLSDALGAIGITELRDTVTEPNEDGWTLRGDTDALRAIVRIQDVELAYLRQLRAVPWWLAWIIAMAAFVVGFLIGWLPS